MKKEKLKNISLNIGSGMTPLRSNPEYWNSNDIPWVKTELLGNYKIYEATEYISQKAFEENHLTIYPKNTLSIAMYGEGKTRGNVSIFEKPMTTNQACCNVVIDTKKADYRYVYYAIKNSYEDLRALSSGVRKNLNSDQIKNFEIPFCSLLTQQKIASVLSSLDDKIALNNRINAKLEQMAKRLYDYWFVQFDFPITEEYAKSHPEFVSGSPYKSNGGKMVWNEELKREIPEGWEVKKISEILECEIPGDWGEENIKGKHDYKVSCIRGCDMVDMTDLPTRYILQANEKKLLQADDFVIEISGGSPTQSTGRIVQVTEEIINRFDNKVICSNFCHGVRVANKNYISYFYQMWNMFNDNGVFFNFEGKTSGLKNFQFDTFVDQKWYFPSEDLAKRFNETAMKFRKEIDKNETENKRLSQLRDKLLPLLMNGQVVVE